MPAVLRRFALILSLSKDELVVLRQAQHEGQCVSPHPELVEGGGRRLRMMVRAMTIWGSERLPYAENRPISWSQCMQSKKGTTPIALRRSWLSNNFSKFIQLVI